MSHSNGRNCSIIPLIHAWSFQRPAVTTSQVATRLLSDGSEVHIHEIVTNRSRFRNKCLD